MSNNAKSISFEENQVQLEIIKPIENESDHLKLMKAYEKLFKKIDLLIEKKKSTINKS